MGPLTAERPQKIFRAIPAPVSLLNIQIGEKICRIIQGGAQISVDQQPAVQLLNCCVPLLHLFLKLPHGEILQNKTSILP